MHVLITADTLGGVWTYTRELVSGLLRRGYRVTLVSFGKPPSAEQVCWMEALDGLDYRPTAFRLEWMQDAKPEIVESAAYLEGVMREVKPDLLHFNQFAYGALNSDVPRVVVAHSDVVSWWVAVHGQEPGESDWLRWYRDTVTRGLRHAHAVVTPSRWMMDAIHTYYLRPEFETVIHNGRSPSLFDARAEKDDCVLAVGRLWDQAKQVSLLVKHEHPVPVCIVGSEEHPEKVLGGQAMLAGDRQGLKFLGPQSQDQLRQLYARASAYAATSCYEPFGLAPLEAALSRCALLANDIPIFRELWGESAYYFRHNDADSLAAAIQMMSRSPKLRGEYAERAYERATTSFGSERMVDDYQRLYRTLVAKEPVP